MRSGELKASGKTRAWQQRSRLAAAERNGGSALRRVGAVAKRKSSALAGFRRQVLERDDHKCQFPHFRAGIACEGPLDVQHVIPRSVRPDLRHDPHNGVAICRRSHTWVGEHPEAARKLGFHGHAWDTVRNGRVVR